MQNSTPIMKSAADIESIATGADSNADAIDMRRRQARHSVHRELIAEREQAEQRRLQEVVMMLKAIAVIVLSAATAADAAPMRADQRIDVMESYLPVRASLPELQRLSPTRSPHGSNGAPELQHCRVLPIVETELQIEIPYAGHVLVKSYDALGRELRTIIDGHHTAGSVIITLTAAEARSGNYTAQLTVGKRQQTLMITATRSHRNTPDENLPQNNALLCSGSMLLRIFRSGSPMRTRPSEPLWTQCP